MKKVAFYTLGCKVNQYETEAISGIFESEGYQVVTFEEKADVYVINTCTVTNLSDRKSRQIIRKAKKNNEDSIIVVTGCYAQTASNEVEEMPEVNLIVGTKDRNKIIEYIKNISDNKVKINLVNDIMKTYIFEELNVDVFKERTRAYIKIQEGCSQYCTYCIIPYARGPVRSRPIDQILNEVRNLAKTGFKEIVLTGIHIASYGKDFENISLIDVIKSVHEIEGIERIRLGSIEPTTINIDFVNEIKKLHKFCPHFHISLQSGCDETLKRMNRKYNTAQYKNSIDILRSSIPDVSVTTDIMVGFPNETEEEFLETYEFLKEINFAKMHVFKYSPRKGTPAAKFKNQVSSEIKEQRSNLLLKLSEENVIKFNEKHIGRIMPVLFEQELKSSNNLFEGLTTNYIRVICDNSDLESVDLKGNIQNITLESICDDYMIGKIV